MFCAEVTETKKEKNNHTENIKINIHFYVLIKPLQKLTKPYTGCTEETMLSVFISKSKCKYTRKMQILLYVFSPLHLKIPIFFLHLKTSAIFFKLLLINQI